MYIMKIKFLMILLFSLTASLYADETIIAPFVSELSVEAQNEKVLLQWKNPAGFKDNLTIFRSDSAIDSADKLLKSEKIALLTNGEDKYIDSPSKEGSYYYAVIITEKESNKNNTVLIPYRNYSMKPAAIEKAAAIQFKKLSVESNETSISIKWEYSSTAKVGKKINIYRSTQPIEDEKALNDSIKIASVEIDALSYVDQPVENIGYYYAVFPEDEAEKTFIKDVNYTSKPVSITKRTVLFQDFSIDTFIPLPLLSLKDDPITGKMFLDPQILKNPVKIAYNKKVKKIINDNKIKFRDIYDETKAQKDEKTKSLEFKMLPDEEIFTTTDYAPEYKDIITNISSKNYDAALAIMENLLKEIIPDKLLVRLSYYIGEIFYYKKNYYMAYIYLNSAYDAYKKETVPYLNSIYEKVFYTLDR